MYTYKVHAHRCSDFYEKLHLSCWFSPKRATKKAFHGANFLEKFMERDTSRD